VLFKLKKFSIKTEIHLLLYLDSDSQDDALTYGSPPLKQLIGQCGKFHWYERLVYIVAPVDFQLTF